MTRPRYPRSNCCVPFCRRTSTLFQAEWIYADHWRLVDRSLKRFWRQQMRKLYRAWEAAEARDPQGREPRRAARRWHAADRTIWQRIKRQAITRAAEAPI